MKKKGDINFIFFVAVSLVVTIIFLIFLYKKSEIILKEYEVKKLEINANEKILKIAIVTEPDNKIPLEFKDIKKYLEGEGYKVYFDKVSFLNHDYLKNYNIIFCDKKINNNYQREVLSKLVDSSSKLIIFRDCRDVLEDKLLGIKYEGHFFLFKDKAYTIIPNNDNPLVEFPEKELRYVPLINTELLRVTCNQITLLTIKDQSSTTSICFTPPNILYIPYTMSDYFKDKPYYYSLILEKFLINQ